MFIHVLKKGHQPGVYMPLRALFLVFMYTRNYHLVKNLKSNSMESNIKVRAYFY